MAIEGAEIVKAAGYIGAGLAMGLGAIGPGVGEGMVAAKACEAIGKNPKEAGLLTRTMLVGQAVSESTGIYSLVVALLLLSRAALWLAPFAVMWLPTWLAVY